MQARVLHGAVTGHSLYIVRRPPVAAHPPSMTLRHQSVRLIELTLSGLTGLGVRADEWRLR